MTSTTTMTTQRTSKQMEKVNESPARGSHFHLVWVGRATQGCAPATAPTKSLRAAKEYAEATSKHMESGLNRCEDWEA